jgi:predicted metal-dependent peptidase
MLWWLIYFLSPVKNDFTIVNSRHNRRFSHLYPAQSTFLAKVGVELDTIPLSPTGCSTAILEKNIGTSAS